MSDGCDETSIREGRRLRGWARRALYGGGGPAGRAARAAARPAAWAWGRLAHRRLAGRLAATRLPAPTIAVGNVTVGGGGKTSLVSWLVREGLPEGARGAVLARGYGGSGTGTWVLEPGGSPWPAVVGDEPAMLARDGVWVGVGRNRVRAARALAERCRPDVFVLDDGLQHRQVARALDLVVFTTEDLDAPARCLPAGPLRQAPGWRPAVGAWVVVGADPAMHRTTAGTIGKAFADWWSDLPGFVARWSDVGTIELTAWRDGGEAPFEPIGRPVVAFAGVAKPASVGRFAALAGVELVKMVAFPDHHRYRADEIGDLMADHPGAAFVTTEKDAVKIDPAWFGGRPVGVLRRHLEPLDPDSLRELVREAIGWAT